MYSTLLLCLVNLAFSFGTQCTRPNIIFFLADDMGWNDVGFHGMTQVPTPNIDTLAYNGIILNNYYVHPACSPSRSALLSGKYATTTGLQHVVIYDPQPVGLPLQLQTLPEHLNCLGYRSHMIGKWHLGFHSKRYTPLYRGFRSHYGFWQGNSDFFFHTTYSDYPKEEVNRVPCYETDSNLTIGGLNFRDDFDRVNRPGEYLTYLYTERATKIIKNHNQDKPLFLYMAHHGIHRGNFFLPVRAPKSLTNLFPNLKSDPTRQNFAGSLTALDRSLGDIMEALQSRGMLNNTIIVFAADNGAPIPTDGSWNGGSNHPLRGGKVTGWEGGVRANAYVWSNNLKNKGTIYDGLMHISDWIPTLYSAAGGKMAAKDLNNLDGKDMWDAIKSNLTSPRKDVILQSDSISNLTSYRSGDYKIVFGEDAAPKNPNEYYGDPGTEPPPPGLPINGSKTERVLRNFLGRNFKTSGTPIVINCGNKSKAVACEPTKAYCLFNIKEDPCEYRNLASTEPKILERLRTELSQKFVSPPNFPNGEYASNPVYYNGFWSPWTDLNYNIYSNSC